MALPLSSAEANAAEMRDEEGRDRRRGTAVEEEEEAEYESDDDRRDEKLDAGFAFSAASFDDEDPVEATAMRIRVSSVSARARMERARPARLLLPLLFLLLSAAAGDDDKEGGSEEEEIEGWMKTFDSSSLAPRGVEYCLLKGIIVGNRGLEEGGGRGGRTKLLSLFSSSSFFL